MIPNEPDTSRSNPDPGHVLVVDDDAAVRQFVHRVLTGVGHRVDLAAGVAEALDCFAAARYDVALVDLDMPERNGLHLLDELHTARVDVVPVLLTGTGDVGAAVTAMKRGAFDYLAKPADPVAIRWAVARAMDVARAGRRERMLETIAADWSATFDACPDLVIVLNDRTEVVRANRAAARSAGRPAADLTGVPIRDVYAGTFGEAIHTTVLRQLTGETAAVKVFDPASGRFYLISASPLPAAGVIVVARDVSELVTARRLQARLFQQLLTAQEDERGRIARELHDGIAQGLVTLSIGLGAAPDADRLRELEATASETLAEIRRLVQGLHPLVLDDLGLVPALQRLTASLARAHGVRVELVVVSAPPGRLPRAIELAVYRIAQEALTNAMKHAKAKTVDVTLDAAQGAVALSVTDDGCGFAAEDAARPRGSLGLSTMRERAEMARGRCRIESRLQTGTTVSVVLPLPES